jgi:tetratricopeptide (TPR) repeat protein
VTPPPPGDLKHVAAQPDNLRRRPKHARQRRPLLWSFVAILLMVAAALLALMHLAPERFQRLAQSLDSLLQNPGTTANIGHRPETPMAPETRPELEAAPEDAAASVLGETDALAPPPASMSRTGGAARRISALLSQADQQMARFQYIEPQNDNALESYHEVLRLDPRNLDARQGIERIKSGFLLWADYARKRGDLDKAHEHLEAASIVDPESADVRKLLEEIDRERRSRASPRTTQNN